MLWISVKAVPKLNPLRVEIRQRGDNGLDKHIENIPKQRARVGVAAADEVGEQPLEQPAERVARGVDKPVKGEADSGGADRDRTMNFQRRTHQDASRAYSSRQPGLGKLLRN